jgi:tetratricopeptide (TPR) repeat protein/CBS domain-containing protein
LMPDYTASIGAYALVGMGTAFAGIVRVPLTSVIMVFEITRDYSIIVPLMISNLISYFISSRLQHEPIYEALQHQDGIHLPTGAVARQELLMVGHAYRPDAQILSASQTIAQAAASVDRERGAWPVVDSAGLRGMVATEQLDEAIRSGYGEDPVARLVPEPGAVDSLTAAIFPHVHPDQSLDVAMRRLAESEPKVLPVVSRTNVRELKGTISIPDILAAYAVGTETTVSGAATSAPAKTVTPALIGVLGALMALAVAAGFLNYFYRSERVKRADRDYQAGNELMKKDRFAEAVEHYRNALSISHSVQHRQALGVALIEAGSLNEASLYLEQVLREQPNSGPANFGMARIAAAQGRVDDAVLRYRRAIYGSWPDHALQNRIKVRLDLVEFLKSAKRQPQAQAELLSLASDLPDDPALQKQVGKMLIDYGLLKQAADVFRSLLAHGPPDAGEYDGLGEAMYRLGDYAAARDAFRSALKIDPTDQVASRRLETSEKVLALDPTQRGVGPRERFQRSEEILKLAMAGLAACDGSERPSVVAARAALSRRKRPPSYSDAAESNLSVAEQLWTERSQIKECRTLSPDDPLTRILARLAAR